MQSSLQAALISVIVATVVSGCSGIVGMGVTAQRDPTTLPLSSSPIEKVEVVSSSGSLNALSFTATYATSADLPGCMHTKGVIESYGVPQTTSVSLPVRRVAGFRTVDLFIDKFRPGYCKWTLKDVSVTVNSPGRGQAAAVIAVNDAWYRLNFRLTGVTDCTFGKCSRLPTPVIAAPDPSHAMIYLKCDKAAGQFACDGLAGSWAYTRIGEHEPPNAPVRMSSETKQVLLQVD